MKEDKIEYRVSCPANRINELIRIEIDRDWFNKKYNLNGEHSKSGGFNLFSTSFFPYYSYETAFVMLNLTVVNINQDGTESKLILKKMKALGYKYRFWMIVLFILITSVTSIYLVYNSNLEDRFLLLALPLIGILILILIDFIAGYRLNNLIKTIEKYLKNEGIEFKNYNKSSVSTSP